MRPFAAAAQGTHDRATHRTRTRRDPADGRLGTVVVPGEEDVDRLPGDLALDDERAGEGTASANPWKSRAPGPARRARSGYRGFQFGGAS
jgi:hypothetical protein